MIAPNIFCPECGKYFKDEMDPKTKDKFTAIMHEAIDTTSLPKIHNSAITREEAYTFMKKYAEDIKWNHAGKIRKQ